MIQAISSVVQYWHSNIASSPKAKTKFVMFSIWMYGDTAKPMIDYEDHALHTVYNYRRCIIIIYLTFFKESILCMCLIYSRKLACQKYTNL